MLYKNGISTFMLIEKWDTVALLKNINSKSYVIASRFEVDEIKGTCNWGSGEYPTNFFEAVKCYKKTALEGRKNNGKAKL